jgi:hypothetical protein
VSVVLLAFLAAAAYLIWTWAPVYSLHYSVLEIVDDYGHRAVKNRNDAELIAGMVEKIHALGQIAVLGASGNEEMRPIVDVRPEDVTWERIPPDALHVAFDYDRLVELPLLGRRLERVMHIDRTIDISRANWRASG